MPSSTFVASQPHRSTCHRVYRSKTKSRARDRRRRSDVPSSNRYILSVRLHPDLRNHCRVTCITRPCSVVTDDKPPIATGGQTFSSTCDLSQEAPLPCCLPAFHIPLILPQPCKYLRLASIVQHPVIKKRHF